MKQSNNELIREVARLASIVERITMPIPPIPPIPAIPAIPPIPPIPPVSNLDHDLLTKLDTKVDQIQSDVNVLKNQGSLYVSQTEHRAVCDNVADHESRIRILETAVTRVMTWGSVGILAIGIIEFLVSKYL